MPFCKHGHDIAKIGRTNAYHCRVCHRNGVRKSKLKLRYGITITEYQALLVAQQGCCAICGQDNFDYPLAVDHNHDTGVVRALLCKNCNLAIGLFKESPELIRNAANYIESHG